MRTHKVLSILTGCSLIGWTVAANCISDGDETTLNAALQAGGQGAVVQICPNSVITVHNQVKYTADDQEISTHGYPTDNSRAIIILEATDPTISTVISGSARNGVKLLNIQIDGNRRRNGVVSNGKQHHFSFLASN